MGTVIFGSARHDENGNYSGGKAGDNLQKSSTNDTVGEVSMQNGYVHSKGWIILRPVTSTLATNMATAMKQACNNKNIGYDQSNRGGIIKYGVNSKVATECDCSSLVRACCIACGFEPGNFTTANARTVLLATGYFKELRFTSLQALRMGDVLVTKTKGHIVVVVSGSTATKSVPTVATPTVKKGSTGVQAKYLQQDLNYLGFSLVEDGQFGAKSVTALTNWQRNNGLTADGIYGNASYKKMNSLING